MTSAQTEETPFLSYPGAQRPDRHRWVDSYGVNIAACEWGPADGPPLFLVHGGSDFAGTFDVFAPLLAAAGWRVISWDHRGHGDSDYAPLYSWDADVRDALSVLDCHHTRSGPRRRPLEGRGHDASARRSPPDAHVEGRHHRRPALARTSPRRLRPRTAALHQQNLAQWLDHRRSAASTFRKPGTIDELAKRRKRMNPRLSDDWLRYLVTIGAKRDAEGWRWKLDPAIRFGGFGPWRPDWSLERLRTLRAPLLGLTATVEEEMGWGTNHKASMPFLPPGASLVPFENTGHFIHIEHPGRVANLVLEFLG